GDVRVAEHELHGAQIGAVFQEMRGEGMAQYVRRNVRSDACLPRVLDDLHPERLTRHRPAAVREKKMRVVFSIEGRPGVLHVRGDRRPCAVAEWNDALLRAFAKRSEEAGVEDEVVDLDSNQLRYAEPGCVEQLEHRRIAHAVRRLDVWRGEQRFDFRWLQR